MKILVLNCGSSSIKYKLFDMNTGEVFAKGGIEKVGMKDSFLQFTDKNGNKVVLKSENMNHKQGIKFILDLLVSKEHGCLKSLNEIDSVGHRVVHGGEKFNSSVLITDEMVKQMEECIELAPLHNPPNLAGIYAIQEILPNVPQVGVFDTAFHQTMPKESYMYALPYSLYEKYGIRRYGFHGTSHRYVSARAAEIVGKDLKDLKMITAHIGNGGSITAIKGGISVDTSMGMTPAEGLIMGTRCGDVDPGVLPYINEKEKLGVNGISDLINKQSGLLGVSGVSSDMRDIQQAIEDGNERAKLVFDMFALRIKKYIGAYIAELNGCDIIVFTGGIGEFSLETREKICENMEFLGIELDKEKNQKAFGIESIVSTPNSKIKVIVIPTDEEFMIASDTKEIVDAMPKI